jgi:L-lactate dehydrogenase (cytochrome)
MKIVNFAGFRAQARKRLPSFLFEYIDGGSYDEHTLLRIAGFYRRRGEVQAVRAAESAGIPMVLSTMSCCPVEEVRAASTRPFWMQLYMIRDREFMKDLMARIEMAGIDTLFLTVDLAINGIRYRDRIGGLAGTQSLVARPDRLVDILFHPAWALDVGVMGRPLTIGNVAPAMPQGAGLKQFQAWVARNFDPSITYKDIAWLRGHWKGKLVLKGITDPGDAARAAEEGMDGIVVSNHGGRQLDGALSSIAALPAVRDAVAGRMTIMLDGGVRSGLDVLRALGLGAQGVLLGRAWAWALAARGEAGVTAMLAIIKEELEVAMALTGQNDVRALDSDLVVTSSCAQPR